MELQGRTTASIQPPAFSSGALIVSAINLLSPLLDALMSGQRLGRLGCKGVGHYRVLNRPSLQDGFAHFRAFPELNPEAEDEEGKALRRAHRVRAPTGEAITLP